MANPQATVYLLQKASSIKKKSVKVKTAADVANSITRKQRQED